MHDYAEPHEDARIAEALMQSFREVLRQHRLAGVPVVVSEHGKVAYVPAEEIERELAARGRTEG
ncbi:MAG: hypothetical protein C4547_14290 [Phycisphaerales bacterium]|nr:MAG: hypothetical protein C4547_14290 [Phycisphaerales bacterium]